MFRQALGCRKHCVFAAIAGSYSGALPPLRTCLVEGANVWKPSEHGLGFVPGVAYDWAVNASDCVDDAYKLGLYNDGPGADSLVSPVWTFTALANFNTSVDAISDTYAIANADGTAESYSVATWLPVRSANLAWRKGGSISINHTWHK